MMVNPCLRSSPTSGIYDSSDSFSGIVHFAAEDGAEDHLDVEEETVMMEVVAVDADFVGLYYFVIVLLSNYIHRLDIAFNLPLRHKLCNHFVLEQLYLFIFYDRDILSSQSLIV